jgi:DNA-binding NtrC family response regulator
MPILIVDDDESIRTALQMLLTSEGMTSLACGSPQEAIAAVRSRPFRLALVDLNYVRDTTSGKEGLALIAKIREVAEDLPVIALTGWGTVALAVEAMQLGAADFIEKPWDNNRLLTTIRTHLKLGAVQGRERRLRAENALLRQDASSGRMLYRSEEMRQLLVMAERVAQSEIPVLITGENGTGKSLLANHIHRHSARASGPFIAVNMGSISESTFESEMFGHTKGAYTDAKNERVGRVELAEQGTLFLDEIANLPLTQQAKILRLLEERCYERLGSSYTRQADVRFVSATNADLHALIEQRSFRQDLLYRLNGVTLRMPALRERPDDIMLLAEDFLQRASRRFESAAAGFSPSARTALQRHSWPGNIRELQHVVERAVLLAQHELVTERDLQLQERPAAQGDEEKAIDGLTLEDAEVWLIQRALARHDGNPVAAARALGISRSALYRRLGKRKPS